MPFKEPALALRDIAEAIDAIKQFTRDMDKAGFRADAKTVAAVERKLQVISEAAIRLGDQAEILCPGLPWRNIRGIGNWLRHQYDRVDVEAIWRTVVDDLPPLQSAFACCLIHPAERLSPIALSSGCPFLFTSITFVVTLL